MSEVVLLFLTSDIILYPLTSLPLHYIEGPVAVRSERGFHSHAVFVLVFLVLPHCSPLESQSNEKCESMMLSSLSFFICRSWTLLTLAIQVTSTVCVTALQRSSLGRPTQDQSEAHTWVRLFTPYGCYPSGFTFDRFVRACVVIEQLTDSTLSEHRCECMKDE